MWLNSLRYWTFRPPVSSTSSESSIRRSDGSGTSCGEAVFNGKGRCSACHEVPYYTDNLMHKLHAQRFYQPQMVNGGHAVADGPIKTFPLGGIKDSSPYLHDRLLTLDDTVEYFNLIPGTRLSEQEKQDLVAFLRTL
jgi:cytochrome c peroxidase